MKLSLEHLDTRGLVLELPGRGEPSVTIASTSSLRGTLVSAGGETTLSDVRADALVLASLRLVFGDLLLSSASGATLTGLGVTLEHSTERLGLDTRVTSLTASELGVVIDDVSVRGGVRIAGVKLVVDDQGGELFAEHVAFEPFHLRLGDLELAADEARGASVTIGWGSRGFRLVAGSLECPSLRVIAPAARVLAREVALSGLSLDRGRITANRATAGSARIEAELHGERASGAATPTPTPTAREPLFDLGVLDALSGQLDVDVELDLTVPIIGRRRATHRLRVAIDQGTIDYRALESNLSALEDAILDFAVRDGALVLERVNPLFPARGHGKPVVAWPLDDADLELAKSDRVRLSVLPHAQIVGSDEPSGAHPETKKSAIALRHLGLVNVDARLALSPVSGALGQIRPKRLASLILGGNVYYDPGDATPPGALRGEVRSLAASLHGVRLGARTLDAAFELTTLTGLEVSFSDVTPTSVTLDLTDLLVTDLATLPER